MKSNNNNDKEQKRFYIALYSTVAIIAAAAFLVSISNKGNSPESNNLTAAADETTGAAAAEPVNKLNVRSYKEETTAETTETTTEKKIAVVSEPKTETTTQKAAVSQEQEQPQYSLFDEGQEMIWPVSGKIVMDYSMETAVYDKTLDQYRTNDSLCISANPGDNVLAAADGVVEQILKTNEDGNKVVINHGNGWLSTYSQLDNVAVAQGQTVHQGDIIANIGQPTNYGVELGTHLKFTVSKDNEAMDPKLVLASEE